MIMPIISLLIILVILIGIYFLYKNEGPIIIHEVKEPKLDKEKLKKEIYNELKENYEKYLKERGVK